MQTKSNTVACEYCGHEVKKKGLFAHQRFHCHKAPGNGGNNDRREPDCDHTFRFLHLNMEDEARAYNYGHRKVCTKCGDLA